MNLNNTLTDVKNILYDILKYFILISGVLIFGTLIWYIVSISRGYYHSDCTDTIFWAEAMIDGKTIMNPDFGYACLLPFGGNLLMLPFVGIWGVSMKAQLAGMVLFALLFTASMVYMCRTMGFNYKWCSLTVGAVLLVLMASPKLREIFWEHIIYYSLGLLFLMLGLGFIFATLNQEKISLRHIILLFIWTALCSTNGSQALAIYCLPAIGAVFTERFLDKSKPLFCKENHKEILICVTMLASVLIGLLVSVVINKGIVAGYQTGYSGFDDMGDWSSNLLSIIPEAFRLFGITVGDQEIYSLDGVFILLKVLFVLVIMLVPLVMLFMYKYFEDKKYRIMILTHTFLSLIIIVCWVFGKLNTACWRLSPIMTTGTILCIMFIRWLHMKKVSTRFIAAPSAFFALILMIISFDVFGLNTENQSESNRQLEAIGEFLEEKDLEYGYGTFWNAGAVTLLTDGEVKIRNITQNQGNLYPRMYQSNENWFKDNSYDKYFLILDIGEYNQYVNSATYIHPMESYVVENRYILVYDFNIMELK